MFPWLQPPSPWDDASQARARQTLAASSALYKYLLEMYAGSRPMTAKDVCSIAFFCKQAGMEGQTATLALNPGRNKGGNFQKHLGRVIPRKPESNYYWIEVPTAGRGGRTIKEIPIVPAHEAIQTEVDTTESLSVESMQSDVRVQD
eukprot:5146436-Pyramimonas_sp.AAC.1